MRRFNKLLEQSERVYIYAGISVLMVIEFFVLLSIYLTRLSIVFVIPIAIINVILAFIFLDRAFKDKKELEKIKEIELVRSTLKDLEKPKGMNSLYKK